MKLLFIFLLLTTSCLITSACDKDPEIITETITVHDTLVVVDTFLLIDTLYETLPDSGTTFILVRHAETTGSGSNPSLSVLGQARAAELTRILGPVTLNAVFSTDYNRTKQTAQPVASAKGVTVISYDPFLSYALIDQCLLTYAKGIVLVVGHSNTIPDLINLMTGTSAYPDLPDTEYDNLFIVQVASKGEAKVLHMKYGG
jgi:broad specificity phosphatase PhoE